MSDDDLRTDVRSADEVTADPVWTGMTLPDFQRIASYIDTVAEALGLGHWTIRLSTLPDDDDDGNMAIVKMTSVDRYATIHLTRDFADNPTEEIETTLIHEILHLYFDPLLHVVSDEMPRLCGEAHATTIDAYLTQHKEQAIDALAGALRPLLPRIV